MILTTLFEGLAVARAVYASVTLVLKRAAEATVPKAAVRSFIGKDGIAGAKRTDSRERNRMEFIVEEFKSGRWMTVERQLNKSVTC
jgi:hypothetical protein